MRKLGGLFACLMLVAGCARAGDDAPPPAGDDAQERLYQEALLALSEGRKTDASRALSKLIEQEPRHAGAWLDLGMIQCSLGHAEAAEKAFATVETRFNPSRDLLDLIAETREAGCSAWHPISSFSMQFGRGVDQNVNQGASNSIFVVDRGGPIELPLLPDFLPKHDQYTLLSTDYLRDLTPNGTLGFVQFQARRNDTLHQYDSTSLFTGAESPFRFGKWTLRTTGMIGMVSLGGQLYQRQLLLQGRLTAPLSLPHNTQLNLLGTLTRTDYLTLANFDALTGELRAQLSGRWDELSASASLGMLDDRGDALRPGGNRHGRYLNVMARRRLPYEVNGELNITRQTWQSQRPYSPALLIDQIRDQATDVLRGSLTYAIGKHQSLQLEARIVRNHENISIFQYNNRQLQLSWLWQPP